MDNLTNHWLGWMNSWICLPPFSEIDNFFTFPCTRRMLIGALAK